MMNGMELVTEILVDYRAWQKCGAIAAGAVYGIALSALFDLMLGFWITQLYPFPFF